MKGIFGGAEGGNFYFRQLSQVLKTYKAHFDLLLILAFPDFLFVKMNFLKKRTGCRGQPVDRTYWLSERI